MINLFINPYKNNLRQSEFDLCLSKNNENRYIDNIYLVRDGERATIQDFFDVMSRHPNDVNIIANLDIYFDDTIRLAERIGKNQCYALTRWEDVKGKVISFSDQHGKPSPPEWSQDAWIFRGSVSQRNFQIVTALHKHSGSSVSIPFTLGVPGCDNKLAAMLKNFNYAVTNPSLSIKAIHLHESELRTYGEYQILNGIKPHGIVYQSYL